MFRFVRFTIASYGAKSLLDKTFSKNFLQFWAVLCCPHHDVLSPTLYESRWYNASGWTLEERPRRYGFCCWSTLLFEGVRPLMYGASVGWQLWYLLDDFGWTFVDQILELDSTVVTSHSFPLTKVLRCETSLSNSSISNGWFLPYCAADAAFMQKKAVNVNNV